MSTSVHAGTGLPDATAAGRSAWAELATAIADVGPLPAPLLLRVDVIGAPAILVDLRHRAFSSPQPIGHYPSAPAAVIVNRVEADDDTPLIFELPGEDLDGLLWRVAIAAGGDAPAPWTVPGQRYRLVRWPNLMPITRDPDHIRLVATLASAHLDAADLAAVTGIDARIAQRVLNALTLMGAVEISITAPPVAAPTVAPQRSIFRRLRLRLGR